MRYKNTYKRRIKKTKKTHRKTHKGGDPDDYSLANIRSILGPKITQKRRQDRIRRRAIKQNVKHKAMLTTLFQEKPPLSGVLKIECKNPDNCLALGQYGYALKKYFNNFSNLSQIDNSKLKRLGAVSNNGFVVEVPFTKGGYTAYTVLKCSLKMESDNLYYEYFVGKEFINTHIKKLPCFVETFGCYMFNNTNAWNRLKSSVEKKSFSGIELQNMISPFINGTEQSEQLFEKSCIRNKLICVLIQHFDNVRSLYDEYEMNFNNIKYDLYNLLYQVYFGLTQLGNTYTHYDLHADNVLLYKPYSGKEFITMRYHSKGEIYEFKSEFVCKIIDYGRNYIKLSNGIDTNNLLTAPNGICNLTSCKPDCGTNVGYGIIQGNSYNPDEDFYNVFPNIPNVSHDLRLVHFMGIFNLNYADQYGTPENLNPGTNGQINNIFDIRNKLEGVMGNNTHPNFNSERQHKKYDSTWKQAAIMEIFDDGRDYTYTIVT